MGDDPTDLDGALYLEEEDTTHPDEVPLLALRNIDNRGRAWGEVWLRPGDLPGLLEALKEQLSTNYARGNRSWRGMPDGPQMNLG